jgi:hypothetical protein
MKSLVLKTISALICGIVFTSMLFLTSCTFTGIQGNGNIVSQERAASEFHGLTINGVGNVNVHPGENYKVEVTTDENLQEFVLVDVKNNVLYIDTKSNIKPTRLILDVHLPDLQSINQSGVGNVKVSEGNASNLVISKSGVGNLDAQNYQVENVTIQHSGVGNSTVWATNSLNGALSGVGNLRYKGNPNVNVSVSGVGKVNKL